MPRRPAHHDLTIIQGDDFLWNFGFKYYDFATSSLKLLNTAGWSAKLKVRTDFDSATVLLEMSTANSRATVGIQGTAPNQYNLSLFCPNAVTAALTDWGQGVWDLKLVDGTGHEQMVMFGTCCLQREVSR